MRVEIEQWAERALLPKKEGASKQISAPGFPSSGSMWWPVLPSTNPGAAGSRQEPSKTKQSLFAGHSNRFGAAQYVQFAEDRLDMALDRHLRDRQIHPDELVGLA
jgi:hypothetical protein